MAKLRNINNDLSRPPPLLRTPPKIADTFYHSIEWRKLVSKLKKQRGNWCQRCGSKHRVIADHIIERRDGGNELDPSNIELLCQAHHNQKTAEARKRRARRAT
jgi:5-methylcytosine-specific restriction enzyme A